LAHCPRIDHGFLPATALHEIAVAAQEQFEIDALYPVPSGTLNDLKTFAPESLGDQFLEIVGAYVRQRIRSLSGRCLNRQVTQQATTTATLNQGNERCDQQKARKDMVAIAVERRP